MRSECVFAAAETNDTKQPRTRSASQYSLFLPSQALPASATGGGSIFFFGSVIFSLSLYTADCYPIRNIVALLAWRLPTVWGDVCEADRGDGRSQRRFAILLVSSCSGTPCIRHRRRECLSQFTAGAAAATRWHRVKFYSDTKAKSTPIGVLLLCESTPTLIEQR